MKILAIALALIWLHGAYGRVTKDPFGSRKSQNSNPNMDRLLKALYEKALKNMGEVPTPTPTPTVSPSHEGSGLSTEDEERTTLSVIPTFYETSSTHMGEGSGTTELEEDEDLGFSGNSSKRSLAKKKRRECRSILRKLKKCREMVGMLGEKPSE